MLAGGGGRPGGCPRVEEPGHLIPACGAGVPACGAGRRAGAAARTGRRDVLRARPGARLAGMDAHGAVPRDSARLRALPGSLGLFVRLSLGRFGGEDVASWRSSSLPSFVSLLLFFIL